jgi:hypothetical protein
LLDTRHLSPGIKCSITEKPIMAGFQKVTANPKQVIDGAVLTSS